MKFEVTLELSETISARSIASLTQQIAEVIANAVEEQQIEIPEAEIIDYDTTYDYEQEFGD